MLEAGGGGGGCPWELSRVGQRVGRPHVRGAGEEGRVQLYCRGEEQKKAEEEEEERDDALVFSFG